MAEPSAVLVTGLQRTGTSAFRAVLGKLPDYKDCGEVCTPLRAKQRDEESFFTFLGQNGAGPDPILRHSYDDCWQNLARYLAHLNELHGDRTMLLDVKYDFLHNFSPASWLFTESPLLLHFTATRQIPVLHFTRSNLLALYFSLQYGQATGKWHHVHGETAPAATTIRLDPADCLTWVSAAHGATDLVRGWAEEQPRALELPYEDLYEEDRVTDRYARAVEELIGSPLPGEGALPFTKTPVNYAEAIENLDEVAAALAGTPFAWMTENLG